jgi:hypothetical protein
VNGFVTWWRGDADARGRTGGEPVGRGAPDRGGGVARRSGEAGSGAVRRRVGVPDRAGMAGGCAGPRTAVDRDGHVGAVDGGQAAHRLGVCDAGPRGVRLAAPQAVLLDRDRSAGARRIDRAQAGAPARTRGGGRDHPDGDREGAARDEVHRAGGPSRLHRGGGRYPLSVRRDAGAARRAGTHPRGRQASAPDRRHGTSARPLPVDRQSPPRDLQDACPPHRPGQGTGR